MLSDRDALYAAIRANPEEDTPRLMFADWLDEQGDTESVTRAEFIRLQCELARLAHDASDSHAVYEFLRDRDYVTRPSADWTKIDDGIHRRIALTMRAEDLVKRHGDEWTPPVPKKAKVRWVGFHRGFIHRLELTEAHKIDAVAEQLRRSAPAVTLTTDTFTSQLVEQFADAGLLGWFNGLELRGDVAAGLRTFGHRPEAAGVRALTVHQGSGTDIAAALADSPHWTGLRSLDLSGTAVYSSDAETLFRAPHLRSLERLNAYGHQWGIEAARALTESGFTKLVSLTLTSCGLDDDAAELLAAAPSLARLRTLDLPHNAVTGRGLTALLCSPHLTNVAYLGLEANPCAGVDAKRLADAPAGGLRMLHCHGSRFRTPDVRALARCPRLRGLWYLDLDANNLGTAAVRALVNGFKDFCPPIIWMTHNRLDDRAAELLADWPAAAALRVLHLRHNARMTDAGARALLDSPHLTNLDGLGVPDVSDETTERLRTRFRHFDIKYH